jgi:LysR family hydrogen peroxide-inducible transcriptional activator
MPLVLVPLKRRCPQLKLVLSEEMTDTLLRRLRGHEIDAALLATPIEEPDLAAMPLFDEPFWLAHPRDHWLYDEDEISQRDLDQIELLLLSDGHCLTHQVMEVCQMSDRQQRGEMADLRAASLETLLQLVGAGFGCTLVPALAVRGAWMTDSGIIARPLDLPDAFRRVQLVYRSSYPRREALDAFAQIITENLPNTVRRPGEASGRRRPRQVGAG